jgi:TRAP-type C4-dicarboxylate transport system permease small subunit
VDTLRMNNHPTPIAMTKLRFVVAIDPPPPGEGKKAMMQRAVAGLDRTIEALACLVLIALLGDVTLGVITRSMGDPLIWTDEIARFLMVWLAVFGWILAARRRTHVRIRFFQDLLPRRGWKATEIAIQFALVIFGIAVSVYGVSLTMRNFDLEATTVPISFAWMYAPMVLAGAVAAGQALSELIELGKHRPDTSPLNESVIE